ncbi:MAG: LysM peptidoglycan-binding domain-containing protein, partial [Burkholderiales bacterium]
AVGFPTMGLVAAMARNQARGKPTDYSSLTMPAETRNYLPKLIAVKNIIADPARFGLQLAAVPNEPYFAVVTVHKHIDVDLAAKFAGMPLDEFKFLNPAHNKAVIKAGEAETIVLPRDRVETFNASLASYEEPLVTWQAYTLKRGERPEKVAAKYGISMTELKQVNGISGRNTFRAGQPLLVPVAAGAEPNLPDLPATPVTLTRAYKAARAKNAKRAAAKNRKAAIKPAAKKTKPAQRAKPATKAETNKSAPATTVVATQDR